ncbi:hypothetical protein FEM48_Zijuj05G0027900 [Ziziphus jujuba var. spinosa]|uniref:Uncharacterized protein n=1 Tax=Ziziphus jujuba var. spinosa TaxID=714518 RepID=A0A978VCD5_ZIZJJ|nr:hypothetical protein FEM48_Zijuj05G0027900 [Ziziphus jujuba var. spinosa]
MGGFGYEIGRIYAPTRQTEKAEANQRTKKEKPTHPNRHRDQTLGKPNPRNLPYGMKQSNLAGSMVVIDQRARPGSLNIHEFHRKSNAKIKLVLFLTLIFWDKECLLPVPKAKSCKSDLAEPKQYLRIASVKTKDHCMHAISDHLWGVKIPCQYDQVLIYPVHVRNLASHISLFSKLVTKVNLHS